MVNSQKLELLVVDDNPGDIRLIREALRDQDPPCHMNTVSDGDAATDFLKKIGKYWDAPRPHLVLLDLDLPKKTGHQVLREIKADPDLCRIPVVVFSSSAAPKDLNDVYGFHANCYIQKPTNLDEFMAVVRSAEHFWMTVVSLPAYEGKRAANGHSGL